MKKVNILSDHSQEFSDIQEESIKRKSNDNQSLSLKTEFIHDKKAFLKRIVCTLYPKLLKVVVCLLMVMLCMSIGINIFLLMDQLTFIESLLIYQKAIELLTLSSTSLLKITKSIISIYSFDFLNCSFIDKESEYLLIHENQKKFHNYYYQVYPLISTTDFKDAMFSQFYLSTYNYSYSNIDQELFLNDTIYSIVDSVVANIMQASNIDLPRYDYYYIIYNSVNSIFQFIRDKIVSINANLLSISNLASGSRPYVMFAIVVVTVNVMFILFFIFTFILSKYPIKLMSLWLEVPSQYLSSAHTKAEEYIATRNSINKEIPDIIGEEETNYLSKTKEEDELISLALGNKK